MKREVCRVTGKAIYDTKKEAANAAKDLRTVRKGRGSARWCIFGDHYHVTKGLRGNKGKGDFR